MTDPSCAAEPATLADVLADVDGIIAVVADVGETPDAVRPAVEHAAALLAR